VKFRWCLYRENLTILISVVLGDCRVGRDEDCGENDCRWGKVGGEETVETGGAV